MKYLADTLPFSFNNCKDEQHPSIKQLKLLILTVKNSYVHKPFLWSKISQHFHILKHDCQNLHKQFKK